MVGELASSLCFGCRGPGSNFYLVIFISTNFDAYDVVPELVPPRIYVLNSN